MFRGLAKFCSKTYFHGNIFVVEREEKGSGDYGLFSWLC